MEEIGNTLLEKYFRRSSSIFIAIFIGIILGISLYCSIPNIILRIISIVCLLGIFSFYIIDTICYNKLPKSKRYDSVLVRIIAKDKNEYDDIQYKFGNEFEKFLNSSKNKINILYIPYHLVESNSYTEKEKIIKLLKKTNCIFLTTVRTRSEETKDNTKYITEFNLGIAHPTYIAKIEKLFQEELNLLGMPTSRVEYFAETKLNVLEVTAQRISIVCRYIIARAYFFSSDFENALDIGEKLYSELNDLREKDFLNIKNMLSTLCYEIHIIKMLIENSKDSNNIDYIEKELNEANKYKKGTYIYYEWMSVCSFLKDRDIKKTKDYLGQCKQIQKNGPWKYSVAFIKAYCDESEGKVIYHYKQAFKVEHDHMQLISFIEDILDQEPEKNMLRFALMLLYLKLGEIKTSKGILKEYLDNGQVNSLDDVTISQLKKIFTNEIVEQLINIE